MGIEDRDYYREKHSPRNLRKSKDFRNNRPIKNITPDFYNSHKKSTIKPLIKFIFLLIVLYSLYWLMA